MCRHDQLCTLTVPVSLGWRLRTCLVASGHSQGLVVRLACAWQHSATWLSGWWRSACALWPPHPSASFPTTFFLPLSQASHMQWNRHVRRGRSPASKVLFMCQGKPTSSLNHWRRALSFQNYFLLLYIDLWWARHHTNLSFWVVLTFASPLRLRREGFLSLAG